MTKKEIAEELRLWADAIGAWPESPVTKKLYELAEEVEKLDISERDD